MINSIPTYNNDISELGQLLERRIKAFDEFKESQRIFTEKMNAELERLGVEITALLREDSFR
ncbi:MAG: hypothetical protein EBR82_10145 [Caulobacteraceae bacterium]|nr:hypothetical protein [Caulobacteraceae bacterium]